MTDTQPGPAPTAAVLVEIFAIGIPGQVVMQVRSVGTEPLTVQEQVRVLRSAADELERPEEEDQP